MKKKHKTVQSDRVHSSFPPMGMEQPAHLGSQSVSPQGALSPVGLQGPQGPQGPLNTLGQDNG